MWKNSPIWRTCEVGQEVQEGLVVQHQDPPEGRRSVQMFIGTFNVYYFCTNALTFSHVWKSIKATSNIEVQVPQVLG